MKYRDHLIQQNKSIKEALAQLDKLAADAILLVVNEHDKLIGSLTDGDVRRGLLKGYEIDQKVVEIIQTHPKFIKKSDYKIEDVISFRKQNFKVIPVVDDEMRIINVINFRFFKSYLPIDTVLMAGGKGTRLRPLTNDIPKPLLKVAEKPIIEHNIDRLISFGVDDFWLSINYLGDQLIDYFKDGNAKGAHIQYIEEEIPLGTIGSVSFVKNFKHNTVLITNSDILTNLDYEDFYMEFVAQKADMAVVTIPYEVNIPYAVMETEGNMVTGFKEKPAYTYFSNGGIYLVKKEILDLIPKEQFYNATDLMEEMIKRNKKLISYPLRGYWLDIGKHKDFEQAQEDFKHIKF